MVAICLVLPVASTAAAQEQARLEKRLTEHRLANGLTFLIYQRPGAPVVSFVTHVDAGSAREVPGTTGIAHMFEHMAFKGTRRIGTTDYRAEKPALDAVDRAFGAFEDERRKAEAADRAKLASLASALAEAQTAARRYVVPEEFERILDRAGAVFVNGMVDVDQTMYFCSLPVNKVEIWAHLESERLLEPVLREFYIEREVVMEERRQRVEESPMGRLVHALWGAAFQVHPYGRPSIGYERDLRSLAREDAWEFHRLHYVPGNIVVAVAGAVEAERIVPMLERYFGRLPPGPMPPPLTVVEPEQTSERIVRVVAPETRMYVEAYRRPGGDHPDDAVYLALVDALSVGRTSRLHRGLVDDRRIATEAFVLSGKPGVKHPHLIMICAVPANGRSYEEIQAAVREEIARIRDEGISDEELERVKAHARAALLQSLESNVGIATRLARSQGLFGDWRKAFRDLERIETVTLEDVRRVARDTFRPANRTVAMTVEESEDG